MAIDVVFLIIGLIFLALNTSLFYDNLKPSGVTWMLPVNFFGIYVSCFITLTAVREIVTRVI